VSRVPGVVLVSIAAVMWGLDGLIRKPLSHSTTATTIVFGEHEDIDEAAQDLRADAFACFLRIREVRRQQHHAHAREQVEDRDHLVVDDRGNVRCRARRLRGDRRGLGFFDTSIDGFWRSFRAALICYPFFLVLLGFRVAAPYWAASGVPRLVAVETIVQPGTYKGFSSDEQAKWHYHKTEIPKVDAKTPDMTQAEAAKLVAQLSPTYGKVYVLWDPMTSAQPDRYDLVVLGSGSTAFAAALRAAELGKTVVMTESRRSSDAPEGQGTTPCESPGTATPPS